MNTQLNIKTPRRLFSLNVVTLLAFVAVMLVLSSPSVRAQTATTTTTDTTATAPTTTTTADAPVDSSITLPAKGTVNDPGGAIPFNGNVIITARRVIDATKISPPLVVLDIDLSALQGSTGTLQTAVVYVTGGNHATEIRPLQASDTIIVSCPYYDSTKDALSARTMLITATLNFDINTGKVTSGTISIGNNTVTPATVGTTTAAM